MCYALPAKILRIDGGVATVDEMGNIKKVKVSMLRDIAVGDYIMVHAGYGIQKYEEEEALKTIGLFREAAELGEKELPIKSA